ncbi:MAG: TIGR04255 family protein [Gammaproteobacteria bacterium]|nr:TIGR04255 family protein [Gammaproteobacteria bacterium]
MTFSTEDPFFGPIPPTVPLPKTPLACVLVQIKFPEILSVAKTEFIADFQECIRADYPFMQKEQNPVWEVMNGDVRESVTQNWRFFDKKRQWRLSLATNFVALETRAYQSRADFIQRIAGVAQALSATINPGVMTRIGVRYVDQIRGPQLEQLSRFVRPEILGLYMGNHRNNLDHTLSETVAKTDVGSITSRWGFMPANQTHDPDLMPPTSAPSWFLDVDLYIEFEQPEIFGADEIGTRVMKLTARAYGFFRWAVNDKFLRQCGGEI